MDTLGGAPQDGGIGAVRSPERREFFRKISALTASAALAATGISDVLASSPPKAIQFEFKDIHGKEIHLKDLKGKWVIVNFWTPSCSICKPQIEDLRKIDTTRASDGREIVVIFIALEYDGLFDNIQSSISSLGLQEKMVVLGGKRRDLNSPMRQVGPVDFFPISYMYSPLGEIEGVGPGRVGNKWVEKIISRHIPLTRQSEKLAFQNNNTIKAD